MARFLCFCTTFILFSSLGSISYASRSYNVLSFGANPMGVKESTRAFLDAWDAACDTPGPTVIYIPKGRYLLGPLRFEGKCRSPRVTFRIDGTLIAPTDYNVLGKEENWITFSEVSGVSIIGGALDAKGTHLWSCKAARKDCPEGATTLRFVRSTDVSVRGLLSLNSQLFHIVINRCRNVWMDGIRIIASGSSPNTDGIHVQLSSFVQITNTAIKTGDDCISIGPGTMNLWVERVACGPGHGISIGSLAKDSEEEGVRNVTIKTTKFMGSDNGLRIKAWGRDSNGFVERVRFLGAVMINVRNPIIIDQYYCPDNNCPSNESGVTINDVIYYGIRGTSSTKVAVRMECSAESPCMKIRMKNVNLVNVDGSATKSLCTNVVGKSLGFVRPDGCL